MPATDRPRPRVVTVAANEKGYCCISPQEPMSPMSFENAWESLKIRLGVDLFNLWKYFVQRFIEYIQLSLVRAMDIDQLQ